MTTVQPTLFDIGIYHGDKKFLAGDDITFQMEHLIVHGRVIGRPSDDEDGIVAVFNLNGIMHLAYLSFSDRYYVADASDVMLLRNVTDTVLYDITLTGCQDKARYAKNLQDRIDASELAQGMTLLHMDVMRYSFLELVDRFVPARYAH